MTKLFPARVDPAAAGKETLAIVSRPDAEALVPPGHRFDLVYPATWRSPYPDGNIYSAAFESATIDWLGRFGLVTDERDLETVRKFSCGRYGGYSSPRSSFRDGLLLTQYVSLWLFWDDRVVEEGLGWSVNDIVAALVEPQVPDAADGFARAWHDLCVRLRRTQSDRWLLRLAIDMEAWMRNAKLETANAARYQSSGELPDFEALLAIRTISIGMYPTFHLIEMAEGLELPDGFHDDPFVRELKRLASALVGYGNDLGGFAKDCLATWPNLVTAMKEQADLGTVDAFRAVVNLHNADVQAFDEVARQLPTWGAQSDVQVSGWVQAVRYSIVGFTLWESVAERYQQVQAVVDGRVLTAPVMFED